jgi:hypothetical protein
MLLSTIPAKRIEPNETNARQLLQYGGTSGASSAMGATVLRVRSQDPAGPGGERTPGMEDFSGGQRRTQSRGHKAGVNGARECRVLSVHVHRA